jgi:hypothetical protein
VIDDDLVAAVRTQGGLDSSRDSLASLDVTNNGTIFGVVAVVEEEELLVRMGMFCVFFASGVRRQIRRWEVCLRCGGMGGPRLRVALDVPLVPSFEEALLGGPGE